MVSMKVRLTGLINQSPQYAIDQARVPIYFVATKKDWSYCASRLLKAQVMGFDTETRPIWSKHQQRNPCALLQIAVRDASQKEEVFILDLLHLPAKVYNATLTSVFLSKTIAKLGQSFYQDLQELAQSYPHASCFTVCKGVVEVNDLSISLAGAHNPLSLQKLVFFYLHRKLAKTQQMSNWARRPLTPSQLHYAAADALVLIYLYDELLMRIQKQHTTKGFRLGDVTNVLDVNLPPAPKCSLCFEVFETASELKKHRKVCTLDVRTLVICEVCEGKKLVTDKVVDHVKHCGVDDDSADEPVMQVKRRKRSLSVESRKSSDKSKQASAPISKKRRLETLVSIQKQLKQVKKLGSSRVADAEQDLKKPLTKSQIKKARKRKAKALAALKVQLAAGETLSQKAETSSSRGQGYRKRKMSMESSLLASDAMWSQISSDCESFTSAA
ncbi:hypothetical protein PHYPSEUDO_000504 [Phytophthora pseudosyringae]|uniref:3'-5' exonuclease domain-containing protein n=1 Tax=Phytophthora pseudosyringae TaxID=221518 RepID=A0A8T1V3R7_9STRA|nr:hypothetical protein PHYPSEUDO_000504 [Phytophthora pseudosyringae]